jgi:hypothetical protein
LLAPGVTQDPRGLTSTSNGDLAFGGIRGYQSSYLVDGGDNNNSFFGQARGRYRAPYQFSNEVVQEFRVSSNTYGAELGRAGGAVVNVVTQSGSNHWHGTSFYFLRDSMLNAQHANLNGTPDDRQQQFGFTLGGPIKRNKVFSLAVLTNTFFTCPQPFAFWMEVRYWFPRRERSRCITEIMRTATRHWYSRQRTNFPPWREISAPNCWVIPDSSSWMTPSRRATFSHCG